MDSAALASTVESHQNSDSVRLPAYSVHMDAIRAFAAFLVLAGHARMLFFGRHEAQSGGSAGAPVAGLGLGHHAVIVFFVLSGFLVGNSAWRAMRSGRWSWPQYLLQRMTRLWIVLLPALIIGGILDHAGMQFLSRNHGIYSGPPGQGMVSPSLASESTLSVFFGNAVFLQTIYVPNYGTNAALWSLANEFWYYMAFPPLLLLFFRKRSIWIQGTYLVLVAAILIFIGPSIAALFGVWLLGFGVSVMPLKIPGPYRQAVTIAGVLQFFAINAAVRMNLLSSLVPADVLLGLSFALLLYALVHARQPVRNLTYQIVATHFSRFSYTLYLMHLPFLTFVTALVIKPWNAWPKNPPHYIAAALIVSLTYAYSWLLYLLFERNTNKVRLGISEFLKRRSRREAPLAYAASSGETSRLG